MVVAALTEEHVMSLLKGVVDPELGSDIVELGMAKGVDIADGTVNVTIALTTSGCPLRAQIQKDIRARLGSHPDIDDPKKQIKINWTELTQDEKAAAMAKARFSSIRSRSSGQ